MNRRLLLLASVALLTIGCDLWDPGECGPPFPVNLEKLDGVLFVSEGSCHEAPERRPKGPIELRIDMEAKRLFISYDSPDGWENTKRIEEVWRFD